MSLGGERLNTGAWRGGLAIVVASTLAMQAIVVMASLTAPVLAAVIAADSKLPAHLIGYYSGAIYGLAALSSAAAPYPTARLGVIRLHQILLAATALGLGALALGNGTGFILSALLLGLAYGPINPASTVLLARFAPPHARARIFSLKQTAVPLGGVLAGSATPVLAIWLGWQGAALAIAAGCVLLGVTVQRWRAELDAAPSRPSVRPRVELGRPIRVMLATSGMRDIAAASFAFGAVQFSFSAVFPTVLAGLGWDVVEAGLALSLALLLSIGSRLFWGWTADLIAPRSVLSGLGLLMALAATATAFLQPDWPKPLVLCVAATFGISASAWNGIAIAEVVRRAAPEDIPAVSAGTIALTFAGALAGPLAFSVAASLFETFRPFFLMLAAVSALPGFLLARPR